MRDRDPIEMLRALADDGRDRAVPAPVEDVRLLGARRHRRRVVALTTAAAVAVVALAGGAVATANTVLSSTPEPAAPEPTPSAPTTEPTTDPTLAIDDEVDNTPPEGGWRTEIPDGYPLGAGFPDVTDAAVEGPAEELSPVAGRMPSCVDYPRAGRTDHAGARFVGTGYVESRELAVFADAQAAHAALTQVVKDYAGCVAVVPGTQHEPVEATTFGDASWRMLQDGRPHGLDGVTQVHAVRVGNAVLTVLSTTRTDPVRITRAQLDRMTSTMTAATDPMCVFAADPCERSRPDPTQTPDPPAATDDTTPEGQRPEPSERAPEPSEPEVEWVTEIPEDIELDRQMLAGNGGDFTAPTRSDTLSTAWVLDPCHPTAYPTDAARQDFRTIRQTGPEYGDTRQLGLYPDAATAQEAMAGFRRVLDACAVDTLDSDPSYETRWETRPLAAGEEGLLAVASSYHQGGQVPGAGYVGVVRVGNAVLMVSRSEEGMPQRGVENTTSREVRGLAARIAADMCVFSAGGC